MTQFKQKIFKDCGLKPDFISQSVLNGNWHQPQKFFNRENALDRNYTCDELGLSKGVRAMLPSQNLSRVVHSQCSPTTNGHLQHILVLKYCFAINTLNA